MRKNKHNMTNTALYKVWTNMLGRCYNPNHPKFKSYGGRGIKVCERWRTSFINFYSDVYASYKAGLSIDRINNDGDYEPTNFRWATRLQQQANTSRNIILQYNGVSMNLKEWSKETGIAASVLAYRAQNKMPIEKIFHNGHLAKLKTPII